MDDSGNQTAEIIVSFSGSDSEEETSNHVTVNSTQKTYTAEYLAKNKTEFIRTEVVGNEVIIILSAL